MVHLEGRWLLLYFLHHQQPCDHLHLLLLAAPVVKILSIRPLDRDRRPRLDVLPCLVDKGPWPCVNACVKLERSNKATHMKLRTLRSDAPPIST
ncbi:hypothetical protein BDA96_06G145200 [Sorghum bicolor]|uniref:Uncharacterized protein n=2 Tax=Sorghum bicolor TaxID=4558 RepID=A0A1B6PLR4_SORBI|nr:hypothetical protein BDA96_06G145200 [Sorghum bicolor]KXG26621.1 hypothetical protein SORBI_3006G131300 [Sorghum bicolor]